MAVRSPSARAGHPRRRTHLTKKMRPWRSSSSSQPFGSDIAMPQKNYGAGAACGAHKQQAKQASRMVGVEHERVVVILWLLAVVNEQLIGTVGRRVDNLILGSLVKVPAIGIVHQIDGIGVGSIIVVCSISLAARAPWLGQARRLALCHPRLKLGQRHDARGGIESGAVLKDAAPQRVLFNGRLVSWTVSSA